MKLSSLLAICLVTTFLSASAQDSVTVAGGHFSTSGGRRMWMGKNYRAEWNTPVKVPVIHLATEKGGLKPVKRGGGKQTKSLRLEAANGKEYTLRSIQKFITDKTLPGDLQSEAAADLVSDGVSASYPYASLSVQVLADAAGVPYGKVRLVYIPDDPILGEFREEFKNMLATFEERDPEGIDKVYDTEDVADKLEKDNDNSVDQQALLRARILDMFVMDLDRHEGQWNWGAIDKEKGKTYFPIPKDRDQAFYINQGLLPGFVQGRSLVPQLEGFKAEAKSIERFNFAARNLDRFFLNSLTREDFKNAAEKFVSQMTDDVIERAIAMQPAAIRPISGDKIIQTLKDRRKYLVDEVVEYHYFIAETVNVTGSDKKELFDITRNDDGTVHLVVNKIDKEGEESVLMYERLFDPTETKEIRLWGFDGDDKYVVKGTNDKIKIRLIGGGGSDVFENTSTQPDVIIYDKADGNNIVTGRFKNKISNDTAVNTFNRIYYKYPFQKFFITGGYNPDDGVFIGPSIKFIKHGFRKEPYKHMHQLKVSYAFSTKAVNFKYINEYIGVIGKKTDFLTDLEYKGPNNTINFFGYGPNSVYDKTKTGKFRYYRIRYDLGDMNLQLRHRFSEKVNITFGPSFQFYSLDPDEKLNKIRNIIQSTPAGLDPTKVFERQTYLGGTFSLNIDTRNHPIFPTKGITWITRFSTYAGMTDNSYDNVSQLNSDFSFYLNLIKDRLTFANRTGAGFTMGDGFEFFQAQYLGSEDNLRGYRKNRFAGESKIYNQAELRLRLANFRTYLFPAAFGIMAFLDAGSVKHDIDPGSTTWMTGYGGGIWFSPLRRFLLSISYVASKEDAFPMVGIGWKF